MSHLPHLPTGTAITPSAAYDSEQSLGWYRSAASIMALSYGTLSVPGTIVSTSQGIQTVDGGLALPGIRFGSDASLGFYRASTGRIVQSYGTFTVLGLIQATTLGFEAPGGGPLAPSFYFGSEVSLGFYRSGASTIALSYGTINLTSGGAVTSIASLTVKSGTNNSCGTAVLGSNGSVNVANTYVKTGDLIFLTDQTAGGTLGDLEIGGIRNSSGFTILSTSLTDTSTVAWLIIRPG